MGSKTLPTEKVTWSGGALATEKVELNSPRQGLRFFLLHPGGEQVGGVRRPAVQRCLAVMFNFVFRLSQLLPRWTELPVPMRNLTGKRERRVSVEVTGGLGSESEEQKATRGKK